MLDENPFRNVIRTTTTRSDDPVKRSAGMRQGTGSLPMVASILKARTHVDILHGTRLFAAYRQRHDAAMAKLGDLRSRRTASRASRTIVSIMRPATIP